MKHFALVLIKVYQLAISPLRIFFPECGCRFYPTCSQFTYEAIKERGLIGGIAAGASRILRCNPWTS